MLLSTVAMLALFAPEAKAAPYQFAPAVAYDVGTVPNDIVQADLDGDLDLDLATPNRGTANVSVLLNEGDGIFAAAENYNAGPFPWSIAAGRFDDDEHVDLAVTDTADNEVLVLVNDGAGGFTTGPATAVGNDPRAVAAGDVNGDGLPDLVTANFDDDTVSVLLGNGDGTFDVTTESVGDGPQGVVMVALGGGAGRDLAVTNTNAGTLSVLLGDGMGDFGSPITKDAGPNPGQLTPRDLDRDGEVDLVVANINTSDVSVLLGNGNGTLQDRQPYSAGFNGSPSDVATADVDRDGIVDLVVGDTGNGDITILRGYGDGTFRTAVDFREGDPLSPLAIVVGNLNGDVRPDVAAANFVHSTVGVLLAKLPSVTTLQVDLGAAKIRALGKVKPNHAGKLVFVVLEKKKADGTWKQLDFEIRTLNAESRYAVGFERPAARRCRVTAGFPGDEDHMASQVRKAFGC